LDSKEEVDECKEFAMQAQEMSIVDSEPPLKLRIGDCGLRIVKTTFCFSICNPKSAIRNFIIIGAASLHEQLP